MHGEVAFEDVAELETTLHNSSFAEEEERGKIEQRSSQKCVCKQLASWGMVYTVYLPSLD